MDKIKRLELFDQNIAEPIAGALSAQSMNWYLEYECHRLATELGVKFKAGVETTYQYRSNYAFYERSVVEAADYIHEELRREPIPDVEILHRWNLKKHRDYLSHPGKWQEFDHSEMKKFIERGGHHKEPVLILLWTARLCLLSRLRYGGSDRPKTHPLKIRVLKGMPEMVHAIFSLILEDPGLAGDLASIRTSMHDFFDEFETSFRDSQEYYLELSEDNLIKMWTD